jgi:hypothetical protein
LIDGATGWLDGKPFFGRKTEWCPLPRNRVAELKSRTKKAAPKSGFFIPY